MNNKRWISPFQKIATILQSIDVSKEETIGLLQNLPLCRVRNDLVGIGSMAKSSVGKHFKYQLDTFVSHQLLSRIGCSRRSVSKILRCHLREKDFTQQSDYLS